MRASFKQNRIFYSTCFKYYNYNSYSNHFHIIKHLYCLNKDSLKPFKNNIKLKIDKLSLLLKHLRNSANENDLFSKFESTENIDDETCTKITGSNINLK